MLIDEVRMLLREMTEETIGFRPGHLIQEIPEHLWIESLNTIIICHSTEKKYLAGKSGAYFSQLADYGVAHNIRVIQIWEDLWRTRQNIIISRLNSIFGNTRRIFARSTQIETLTQDTLNDFLMANHLQGKAKCKYKFGLLNQEKLVAVASFSKARTIEREGVPFQSTEMIRFCSALNTTVTGGLHKLLKHFISTNQPGDIMTYTDRDWGMGLTFQKLGFKVIDVLPAMPFWLDPDTRERIFPNKLNPLIHEKGWAITGGDTPEMFLEARGYIRVYNAGNTKYLMKIK